MKSIQPMDESIEARLRQAADLLAYPETPDFAAREKLRLSQLKRPGTAPARLRLAWGLAALLLVGLMAALLVSPVRARVLDWIRIGSVRIFFNRPAPAVTLTPLHSVLNLAGETSLERARQQAGFTIQMPAYPMDLGQLDHVYLQELSGPVVVLVWMDRQAPGKVRMPLSESPSNELLFEKY